VTNLRFGGAVNKEQTWKHVFHPPKRKLVKKRKKEKRKRLATFFRRLGQRHPFGSSVLKTRFY